MPTERTEHDDVVIERDEPLPEETSGTERTPRELETREITQRNEAWKPPSLLPIPTARDGIVFRWIRTSMLGRDDNTNVSSKFRQGWEPVRREEHPELMIMSDRNSEFPDGFEVGGLLLCQTAKENMEARSKHYSNVTSQQMDSVDHNYMRENDPRMPLLAPDRSSNVSFGRGSKK